jgi:hypothetical protein
MELSKVVSWLLVIFIIAMALYAVYLLSRKKPQLPPASSFTDKYNGVAYWGPETPAEGDVDHTNCRTYTFVGSVATTDPICGEYKGEPAQTTLNTAVLDSITPTKTRGCVDTDQIVAKKVTRQCVTASGGQINPSLSFCTKLDGTQAKVGDTETFYSTNGCTSNTPCPGTLGFFGVGYATTPSVPVCNGPVGVGFLCVAPSGPEPNSLNSDYCHMDQTKQLFRIVRSFPGATPPNPNQDPSLNGTVGPLASFLHRDTNTCMIPDLSRNLVVRGSCGVGPVWFLQPPLTGKLLYSPQQTVFVGDLNGVQLEQIFNAKSTDQLIGYLDQFHTKSIQQNLDGKTILAPYYNSLKTNLPDPEIERRITSNIVNYPLYNNILFTTTPYIY